MNRNTSKSPSPNDREKKVSFEEKERETRLCSYENKGTCRNKDKCKDFHPSGTCQHFSKLGSCIDPKTCNSRHPVRICWEWEREGRCRDGNDCRHRHPVEFAFLGLKSPSDHRDSKRPVSRPYQRKSPTSDHHRNKSWKSPRNQDPAPAPAPGRGLRK